MAFYLLIILAGLGSAVWLFFSENQKEKDKKQPNLLDRLGLNSDKVQPVKVPPSDILNPKDLFPEKTDILTQNANVKSEEFLDIKESSNFEHELHELKKKYEKLDVLFKEKSEDLERKENSLEIELKAKKEFNKVKDLLEKEIKDKKDEGHKLQLELNANQVEIESNKKRIAQLEEKIRSKEQNIKEQEKQIADLTKEMQSLTSKLTAAQALKPQNIQPPLQPPNPIHTNTPTAIETKPEITITKDPQEPPLLQKPEPPTVQVPTEPPVVEQSKTHKTIPLPEHKPEPEKEKPTNETINQPPNG